MGRKVISVANLPMRSPLLASLIAYLFYEQHPQPEWAWGILFGIMAMAWMGWIADFVGSKKIQMFGDRDA